MGYIPRTDYPRKSPVLGEHVDDNKKYFVYYITLAPNGRMRGSADRCCSGLKHLPKDVDRLYPCSDAVTFSFFYNPEPVYWGN